LPIRHLLAIWLVDKQLDEDNGVVAANREQSCSNCCDLTEEKLIKLEERLVGGRGMLLQHLMESLLIW
jgi:hypothetical protein